MADIAVRMNPAEEASEKALEEVFSSLERGESLSILQARSSGKPMKPQSSYICGIGCVLVISGSMAAGLFEHLMSFFFR